MRIVHTGLKVRHRVPMAVETPCSAPCMSAANLAQDRAVHPRPSPAQRRGGAKLVVTAVPRKPVRFGPVAPPGACRAVLSYQGYSTEIDEGHLAGLVAWVLGVEHIDISLSTFTEHSHRVGPRKPLHSAALERRRASLDIAIRDEAWFLRHADEAFVAACSGGAQRQTQFALWGPDLLARALDLVPLDRRANSRFGTVVPATDQKSAGTGGG